MDKFTKSVLSVVVVAIISVILLGCEPSDQFKMARAATPKEPESFNVSHAKSLVANMVYVKEGNFGPCYAYVPNNAGLGTHPSYLVNVPCADIVKEIHHVK